MIPDAYIPHPYLEVAQREAVKSVTSLACVSLMQYRLPTFQSCIPECNLIRLHLRKK